jgi:DNA-directed RNA polymerase subunit RPC12/RpoP
MERTVDNHFTTVDMLGRGMYVCHSCGKINSIDDSNCIQCNDEKFILMRHKSKTKEK